MPHSAPDNPGAKRFQPPSRLRVLHMVGVMDRGGIENLLLALLRRMDRPRWHFDFCCIEGRGEGELAPECKALGARFFACDRHPAATFPLRLRRLLAEGRWDAVHAHLGWNNAPACLAALWAGVPVRIAHAHAAGALASARKSAMRRLAFAPLTRWSATAALACSRQAGDFYFDKGWDRSLPGGVLPNPIDLGPFLNPAPRAEARAKLGLPEDALVVGHVGRLDRAKNHAFLLEAFARLSRTEPGARMLLVGEGEERPAIEAGIWRLGLEGRVVLAGSLPREEVVRLLPGAADAMAFPSLYEGFGIAIVESQAAGLPVVIAEHLPPEVVVLTERVTRLPLERPAEEWAQTILTATRLPRLAPAEAVARLRGSAVDIEGPYLARLAELYEGACADSGAR